MTQKELEKELPILLFPQALPEKLAEEVLLREMNLMPDMSAPVHVVSGKKVEGHRISTAHEISYYEPSDPIVRARNFVSKIVQEKGYPEWESNYVIVNVYRNGKETIGSHSDQLSQLGPCPIIVGVSLGATRIFRFRPIEEKDGNRGSTTGTGSYSIPLNHRDILVMLPQCQMDFKHEVPAESEFRQHPKSGPIRVSLTFRMRRRDYMKRAPLCTCDKPTKLKPSHTGENKGRCYWRCNTTNQCKTFVWDDEIDKIKDKPEGST